MSALDLIGKKFKLFTVIERVENYKEKYSMFLCECECGTFKKIRGSKLKSGDSPYSCGCKKKKYIKPKTGIRQSTKDKWIGRKYGRWTILDMFEEAGVIRVMAKCECGTEKTLRKDTLTKGHSKSCGCIAKETTRLKPPKTPKQKKYKTPEIGDKYGKLTIIDLAPRSKDNRLQFKFKCECGGEKIAVLKDVRLGNISSCGCLTAAKQLFDIGQIVKDVEVISYDKKANKYKCRCLLCGNITTKLAASLSRKGELRCKCKQKEINTHKARKHLREHLTKFRKKVLYKYNYTCRKCGRTHEDNKMLHVHHAMSFMEYPKYRLYVSNGILLCKKCHKEFHDRYTYYNASVYDLIEYLKQGYGWIK